MKVINIISDKNIGGAGKCVLVFGEKYNKNEFDLTVIVPEDSKLIPELNKREIEYLTAQGIADKSLSLKGVLELKKLLLKHKPDVVHTHGTMSGRIAARLAGIKNIIYTLHCVYEPSSFMKSPIGKFINKAVSALFSKKIIAVADAAKDNLIKVGINENKIDVVLNGIIPIDKDFDIISLKKRFEINDDEKVVSIVARLEDIKGHKYFIDAAKIIKDKGYKAKFIIAGTGSYEQELKKYAIEKGNPVVFTGFISDPENLLAVTDISVNASYGTEATSISLLEGMCMGIPAVVSNYGGNPGVIEDGVNGYLFPAHSSEILAQKLELLLNDDNLYKTMSENAVSIFNKKFTADIYARNIENVYKNIRKER